MEYNENEIVTLSLERYEQMKEEIKELKEEIEELTERIERFENAFKKQYVYRENTNVPGIEVIVNREVLDEYIKIEMSESTIFGTKPVVGIKYIGGNE
jgi:predicted  nucleic acid-binding Zn-ribbon protein